MLTARAVLASPRVSLAFSGATLAVSLGSAAKDSLLP